MESLFSKLIWQQENVLDEDFCKSVIDKFESDQNVYSGITFSGLNPAVKKTTDLLISKFEYWNEQDLILYKILNEKLAEYRNYLYKINTALNPFYENEIEDSGYLLQKYEIKNDQNDSGGYYTWHTDQHFEKTRIRVLTYIWYLNEVNDGGETEFIDGTLIKPTTGKMVIFPATWEYVHRGNEPISNSKYICTGWIYFKKTV